MLGAAQFCAHLSFLIARRLPAPALPPPPLRKWAQTATSGEPELRFAPTFLGEGGVQWAVGASHAASSRARAAVSASPDGSTPARLTSWVTVPSRSASTQAAR